MVSLQPQAGGGHMPFIYVSSQAKSPGLIYEHSLPSKPIQTWINEQQGDTAAVKLVILYFGVVLIQVSGKEEAMKAALCSTGLLWCCLIDSKPN